MDHSQLDALVRAPIKHSEGLIHVVEYHKCVYLACEHARAGAHTCTGSLHMHNQLKPTHAAWCIRSYGQRSSS